MSELSRIGIKIPIHAVSYKIEPAIPFEKDEQHVFREPELISIYFDTLRFADFQLKIFGRDYFSNNNLFNSKDFLAFERAPESISFAVSPKNFADTI